jgi:hypothetical protein
MFILSQASQIGISTWLQTYADNLGTDRQQSLGMFFGAYGALVLLYFGLDITVNILIFAGADTLLEKVLRLPMSFFDTTP